MLKNQTQILVKTFEPQTQSISVKLYPILNKTERSEIKSCTERTGILIAESSALIPGFTRPLQVPTKNIGSNSDIHNEPNTSENFKFQENSSGVTSQQFHIQNTATLLFSSF